MNFLALRTALSDRGFQYLTATQLGEDVNAAVQLLDGMYCWPYKETFVVGVAPLTVTDLGTIEAVTNETSDYQLAPGDYRSLLSDFGDLALTGSPQYFYVATPAGVPDVATYPTDTSTIGVQYWKVTPALSADTDTPLAPTRFHPLLIDLAVQRAYIRKDNFQAAQALQPFVDQQLSAMIDQLLGGQQVAGPQGHTLVTESCDG